MGITDIKILKLV